LTSEALRARAELSFLSTLTTIAMMMADATKVNKLWQHQKKEPSAELCFINYLSWPVVRLFFQWKLSTLELSTSSSA